MKYYIYCYLMRRTTPPMRIFFHLYFKVQALVQTIIFTKITQRMVQFLNAQVDMGTQL